MHYHKTVTHHTSDVYILFFFQIRTKTIINLAYLITEEEDHLINADDDNFVLLIKILESCLERPDHHSKKYGFWATEVLEVFNLLAAIDSNKVGTLLIRYFK